MLLIRASQIPSASLFQWLDLDLNKHWVLSGWTVPESTSSAKVKGQKLSSPPLPYVCWGVHDSHFPPLAHCHLDLCGFLEFYSRKVSSFSENRLKSFAGRLASPHRLHLLMAVFFDLGQITPNPETSNLPGTPWRKQTFTKHLSTEGCAKCLQDEGL